jgi:hypothetical protein
MENLNEKIISYNDDFFTKTEQKIIHDYCLNAGYHYGEIDGPADPISGMTHEIPENEFVYKLLKKTLYDRVDFIRDLNLYRMYVNCFAPSETPNFHIDGLTGYTFLYYPIMREHEVNDGGETIFFVENDLMGILPISNRMVVFDATILHKATSFRNDYRFTVAIKYK